MRLTLLAGVAALSFVGATGAQAQTIYTTDPIYTTNPVYTADPAYTTGVYTTGSNVVVSQPNVIATAPGQVYPGQVYAVPAPPFGPFTPQYVVTQPAVTVAPPIAAPREQVIERERIVLEPRRRIGTVRERIVERQRVIAPRDRVIERERVVIAPQNRTVVAPETQVVVRPAEPTLVTTGSSTSRSCFIDLRGFERCY